MRKPTLTLFALLATMSCAAFAQSSSGTTPRFVIKNPAPFSCSTNGCPPSAPLDDKLNPYQPLPATATLGATSLVFGTLDLGQTSNPQSVSLTNNGELPLNITGISVSVGATDFGQSNTCGSTLGKSASCSIDVSFTPYKAGARAGYLSVTSSTGVQHVELRGTAVGHARLQLSATDLPFGDVDVGSPRELPLTITNSGTDELTIGGITVSGGGSLFSINKSCLTTLQPGDSCTENVTFSPATYTAVPQGVLSVVSNAGNQNVTLSGQGYAGVLTLEVKAGSSTSFSGVARGATKSNFYRVYNAGNKAIASVSASLQTTVPLTITSNTCTGPLGAAGSANSSCDLTVTYAPTTVESFSNAILALNSSATNPLSTMSLSGSSVSPTPTVGALTLPTGKKVGDTAVVLTNPTSTSNGAWTYSSNPAGVVTFSGNTMTFVAAGTTEVTATQAATSTYDSVAVKASITVLTPPTLGTFTIASKTTSSGAFTLTPPSSNSSGTWSYSSSNTGVATISGSTVTIKGAGSSTITATQAASGAYASGSKQATLTVAQAYGGDVVVVNGIAFSNRAANPYVNSGARLNVAADYCAAATIGGVAGWRLPTVAELYMFYGAYSSAYRTEIAFNNGNSYTWTSDSSDGAYLYYAVAGAGNAQGYQAARTYDIRSYTWPVICARG